VRERERERERESFRHFALSLSPQQGKTCTHTTHKWEEIILRGL